MSRTIQLDRHYALRVTPVLFGVSAPAVRLDLLTLAGGPPARDTNAGVVIPAALVDRLAQALGAAASESMSGALFAPAEPEQ